MGPRFGSVAWPILALGGTVFTATSVRGASGAGEWVHPAGLIDVATLAEIRRKRDTQPWARQQLDLLDRGVQSWLAHPMARLEELMPTRKMQVYWLLLCPACRKGLRFNPFDDQNAGCPTCGTTYPLTQQSTATPPTSHYAGTLYDGWGCFYLQNIARIAEHLALLHALGGEPRYAARSADILRLFARRTRGLPVKGSGTQHVIWTYNMEGDSSILISLTTAYELLRGADGLFTAEEHINVRQDLLKHWADSVYRVEEDSSVRHNNMYQFLSVVALVGCALEDTDYVDWAFGRRAYSPKARPSHRSLAWLADNNYLEDGAFWGLCAAYHLYALGPHCRALVLGSRLAKQMPALFPPELYDESDPTHPRGRVARRAIRWFTAQAFPDLTMAPNGDMGGRVSLATYALTAEIGYRWLGVEEVGSYASLRTGSRGLTGLLYGAEAIEEESIALQSAFLSSGFVALKRQTEDNQLYVGLNALVPGSGHCHGDRLSIVTYSRDRMLAGEKRTEYTHPEQRVYSGASYGHSTITVDEASQVHANVLKGDRVPHVDTFVDLPAAQVAEAHGDQVYPQTKLYRRLLCQFDEYLVDIFRVRGGKVHDWFFHGVGEEPEVTTPLESHPSFEPSLYVVRGAPEYRAGVTDQSFSATWPIPADPKSDVPGRRRDVFSRVTLAACPGQEVSVLRTYPNPGAHSLLVRHVESSDPFVALHEAYVDRPIATEVVSLGGSAAAAVAIAHADGSRRVVVHGPGELGEEAAVDGLLGVVHLDADGRLRSLALVRGTLLRYRGLQLQSTSGQAVSASLSLDAGQVTAVSSPPIAYRTVEGEPVFTPGQAADVVLGVPEALSPSGRAVNLRIHLPGQTADGPKPVAMALGKAE